MRLVSLFGSCLPPLVIAPLAHRCFDIGRLGALGAAAEQKTERLPCLGIIHLVSRPTINPQLPDPVLAELMVAEVPACQAINPALNSDASPEVFEPVQPLL